MLETIIIYGLYLALPSILLYRSLGPKKTGLIFTGIIALHQTASTNIDQITLPVVTESDTTTILAKNTRDESNKKILLISNKKKFDLVFHRKLEKHFPDWDGRMDFQQKQEKNYKLAMKKQRELRRTGMIDRSTHYTKEELDAIAYFQGTGFYSKLQDPTKTPKPCIYDTRQSFLIKMHDDEIRRNFLKSFNRFNY